MIQTTVIGAYPKPNYLKIPDWFEGTPESLSLTCGYKVNNYTEYNNNLPPDHTYNLIKSLKYVVETQDNIGIDILTDGEIGREHYINYHLRHLDGIDFENLNIKSSRNDAYKHLAPTIISKIKPKEHFLLYDWKLAQLFTKKHIKVTIPGPMTISDTVANKYYQNEDELLEDLSIAINYEIKHLVENGVKYIQIDEPLFARYPDKTLEYGIKYIEKCFQNIPEYIEKTIHICCGYPDKLNETDYPKADPNSYIQIAEELDKSCINVISIEDAHRYNDLKLFSMFKNTSIILGVVSIADTKIESVSEIKQRIETILQYISPEKLLIAPDCGLGMLPIDICNKKLENMVAAVKQLNDNISQPKHITDGIIQGINKLVDGITKGVIDGVSIPIEGYKQNGITGGINGTLDGYNSLTTEPIKGMVLCGSKIFQGTKNKIKTVYKK